MTRFARPLSPILPLTIIALIAAVVVPYCARTPRAQPKPTTPPAAPSAKPAPTPTPVSTNAPERPALAPVTPAASFPRSPLADSLNSPATTPADDLRTVSRLLSLYRERFDAYPAFGDNAQLVNALSGANPHRIPLLARDAPAVSAATGELLDRWGTPYLFHAISRDALEIRSPGPDRAPYTADDVVSSLGAATAPPAGPEVNDSRQGIPAMHRNDEPNDKPQTAIPTDHESRNWHGLNRMRKRAPPSVSRQGRNGHSVILKYPR